jgi:hypothetical protein
MLLNQFFTFEVEIHHFSKVSFDFGKFVRRKSSIEGNNPPLFQSFFRLWKSSFEGKVQLKEILISSNIKLTFPK